MSDASIIPFPTDRPGQRRLGAPADAGHELTQTTSNSVIADRLRRVTGMEPSPRRRLGGRKSDAPEVMLSRATTQPESAPTTPTLVADDGDSMRPADNPTVETAARVTIAEQLARRESDVVGVSGSAESVVLTSPTGSVAEESGATMEAANVDDASPAVAAAASPDGQPTAREPIQRIADTDWSWSDLVPAAPPSVEPAGPMLDQRELPAAVDASEATAGEAIDDVVEDLAATVRELLYCANVGELLHGFALYSDRMLFRTMDESGLTEEQFRQRYERVWERAPEDWVRIARLSDVIRVDPTTVTAVVAYADGRGRTLSAQERYRFVYHTALETWQIDDIAPA